MKPLAKHAADCFFESLNDVCNDFESDMPSAESEDGSLTAAKYRGTNESALFFIRSSIAVAKESSDKSFERIAKEGDLFYFEGKYYREVKE